MILQQFYLKCLAHASYLIGDEASGVAAVVDPQRDIEQYLACAAEHGLRIEHVLLTHLHADFIAGHLELRDRVGARMYLGRPARTEYAFTPLGDGDVIALGQTRLQALSTPGHTPESISIVVFDDARDPRTPVAVLTGDTLFIGDVGRPDLAAAPGASPTALAEALFASLHDRLLTLPDATLVYPAHGAGSLCGKALSKETVSTIGEQRRVNYALQPMSRDGFVQLVTADQPEVPAYFAYDAAMNARERATLDESLARELKPMTLEALLIAQAAGAQILDSRDPVEFAAAHLTGSTNIGLGGQFATWAGTVLDRDRPIVLIAEPGSEAESAMRLGRIGFDQVKGFLQDGLAGASSRADLIQDTARLGPDVAARRMQWAERPVIVDVRNLRERGEKWIEGSLHLPLNHLVERRTEIPADRPVLVHCAGGYRSSIAASLLKGVGLSDVSEIAGLAAWESSGLPLTSNL